MNKLLSFFRQDLLFSFSLLAALASLFFGLPTKGTIDFKVLLSLFGLMLLVKNIEHLGLLQICADALIRFSTSTRSLLLGITFLAFVSSMVLTNDVAILTLMPIYLTITKKIAFGKDKQMGAIMLIVAANLGSSFFPFGNPQNLFLMSHYALSPQTFFSWSFQLLLISAILLLPPLLFTRKQPLKSDPSPTLTISYGQTILPVLSAGLLLSAIFSLTDYRITIPLAVVLLVFNNPPLVKAIDYRLLATFLFFFIAVGGFSQIPQVSTLIKHQLRTPQRTFAGSILLSQFISNVPAAILAAPFTPYAKALFLGVNIGGLGTVIASLANLIGFKIYKIYYPGEEGSFLRRFTLVNVLLLLAFILLFALRV